MQNCDSGGTKLQFQSRVVQNCDPRVFIFNSCFKPMQKCNVQGLGINSDDRRSELVVNRVGQRMCSDLIQAAEDVNSRQVVGIFD